MATLNQFQQYSQGENTITNNVLLMLSALYEISPNFYEDYLNALFEENDLIKAVPEFKQQVGNKRNGVIDGQITTRQSSIIIETKINTLESIDKLVKYADSFRSDEVSILIHLSTEVYNESQSLQVGDLLKSKHPNKSIYFFTLTYEDLVTQLNDLLKEHPFIPQLERLASHFEEYTLNMGLMFSTKNILRAMACGQSIDLNIKHQFYFDQADRGFSPFEYFGIYANKSVRYIATVEVEVVADWSDKSGLVVKDSKTLSDHQIKRLSNAIRESVNAGWSISNGHRFFLFDQFVETDYRKTTPGGIFRVKYFNLAEALGNVPTTIEDIAKELRDCTWPKR